MPTLELESISLNQIRNIERTLDGGTITISRAGIPIAVVVPFDQYDDESLSLDEEFALREFLEQENNGTLITYPAAEVRARLELVD